MLSAEPKAEADNMEIMHGTCNLQISQLSVYLLVDN